MRFSFLQARRACTAWLLLATVAAHAQAPEGPPASATPQRPAPVRPAKAEAPPAWAELTPAQKTALEPLAGSWSRLTAEQKRKWVAVSHRYPGMPPGEQARLHTRMAEWAALSPQQRTQARLNFAATSRLPLEDKKARWEAYQALSPEEKRKLAAGAKAVKPAAAASSSAAHDRQARKLRKERARKNKVAPGDVDSKTLLPQPGTIPGNP